MRIVRDYSINEKTVCLTGVYDEFANLCSKVIDGEEKLIVMVPPVELINNALLKVGSDFQGSVHSSKYLLGSIKTPPVHINSKLNICLIPTKSFKQQNCVWFSYSHIKETRAVGRKKTEVHLSFGHTYEINMKENAFNNRCQRARQLKEHIVKNSQSQHSIDPEPKKGFYISEDQTEYDVFKQQE